MPEKREEYDPRFFVWSRRAEPKGILVQELSAGDIIAIETKNSKYILRVLDPEKQKVEITKTKGKGKYFRKPTVTCVEGSCINTCLTRIGMAIRLGWIALGHCLELRSGKSVLIVGNIILTATQSVSINGEQIFPSTDEKGN